ncbi:UDP-N-acetylmuramoyl-L-alanine--D-glutamate ligase [Flavisolibacter ginsenosidimutans]|uniref:UDP-N-acetylmuramoylalanine--D-glutamate ligase n=1 Tax=Flavisolibacter ginsenosidimutans TaxID=661481 RepID=A0A5B8UHC0_9BACT|nr:UDP-N-acetylmuramoyl-L-alanine--D-glutamate ligase [Flavisolibacter ginsenosidimutans]QEC56034.1 UDP-N-acetylmuramoyl-L-alanine--D-glutamate ligase [Flavisolibacter ginsenosidimutans]
MKRKLVILGGGESGVGAAVLAKKKDYDVTLMDESSLKEGYRSELQKAGVLFLEGGVNEDELLNADEVVKSPGIPEKNAWVKKLRAKGVSVISEIELAYRHKGESKIIAITGSNGKSTTTSLIYHICKTAALDCALVGNIGYSFAKQVAEDPKPLYVAEISSFQLDDIVRFRPDVAVLLNITEDHLDRYDYRFENYIRSKFRIAMNQTSGDYFIYNLDDDVIIQYMERNPIHSIQLPMSMKQKVNQGGYIQNDEMHVKTGSEEQSMSVYDFALKGKHNQYNTMAASVAGATMDIRKNKIREAVQTFENLEHRMEPVATVRGVEFINDSKATNVNSTWYALESMTKPTILILGGVDKGNDYTLIEDLVKEKVKAIVCMGVDNSKIHAAFDGITRLVDTGSAENAVQAAFQVAAPGDVVLLSPACASFDLFSNYEDRGKQFKEAVKNL